MKSANIFRFCFVIILGVTTVAQLSATERDKTPVSYFMDQPPVDVDAPKYLPNDAQDVTVAKVRFEQGADGVFWLGGRDCEGCTDHILGFTT